MLFFLQIIGTYLKQGILSNFPKQIRKYLSFLTFILNLQSIKIP